jgi:hypothetical protein
MALIRCILGKFLGVACHCSSPLLDIPTIASRCLYVRHDARDPSGGRWKCGRECCLVILPAMPDFHVTFRDLLHAANLRHGTDGFTFPPKEGVLRIFSSLKIRRLRFEPANLSTKGQHATHRPPKPLQMDTNIVLNFKTEFKKDNKPKKVENWKFKQNNTKPMSTRGKFN